MNKAEEFLELIDFIGEKFAFSEYDEIFDLFKIPIEKVFSMEVLNYICGMLQIIGLVLIICQAAPVMIGVGGFAAIVRVFLPLPINRTAFGLFFTIGGALAGVGMIIIYTIATPFSPINLF